MCELNRHSIQWSDNLITKTGYYKPFVAVSNTGLLAVGDCDGVRVFTTINEAIAHMESFIKLAGSHVNKVPNEYQWHYDSELQLEQLTKLLSSKPWSSLILNKEPVNS